MYRIVLGIGLLLLLWGLYSLFFIFGGGGSWVTFIGVAIVWYAHTQLKPTQQSGSANDRPTPRVNIEYESGSGHPRKFEIIVTKVYEETDDKGVTRKRFDALKASDGFELSFRLERVLGATNTRTGHPIADFEKYLSDI